MNEAPTTGVEMETSAGAAPAAQASQPEDAGTVTIQAQGDAFAVNGKPAATIDDALNMAREILIGDDGGMSVQEAFGKGFGDKDSGPGY